PAGVENAGAEERILMNQQGPLATVRRRDHAQASVTPRPAEAPLLRASLGQVRRRQTEPDLKHVSPLLARGVALAAAHATAGGGALELASAQEPRLSQGVFVVQRALVHVREDLRVLDGQLRGRARWQATLFEDL